MDKIFNDPPDWPTVKAEFERFKRENDLTNAIIAKHLGYASGVTFRANKAYKKVVTGIVRLWLVTK
jgi:L-amino acid N-acyltransferase YncA